jgi:hypothetical protein
MKFIRYDSTEKFGIDVLEILLENEIQNNIMISFIKNDKTLDTSNWLMAAIKNENGNVVLTAACTPPHNIVIYETGNEQNDTAIKLLSDELKSINFNIPGVTAKQGLAQRFADVYSAVNYSKLSMNIMRLDKIKSIPEVPGFCREFNENDMFYMPHWFDAFTVDCKFDAVGIEKNVEIIRTWNGKVKHYIWEVEHPVSTAVNHRNTENGAGIGYVYTPPHYRGNGYASAVVSKLAQDLLEQGNEFCFLFVDTGNPISCGIYRKMGFYDLCAFNDIKFGEENKNGC